MPDALGTFLEMSPAAKVGAVIAGIVAWVAGIWLLDVLRRTYR